MVSYIEYVDYTSGSVLYAKPEPSTTPWSTDIVSGTENGSTGIFAFTLDSNITSYAIYRRIGGSPASTDEKVGRTYPPTKYVVISGAISVTDETDDEDVVYFYNQSPVTKVFLTDTDLSATTVDFVIEKEDKTSICEVLSITPGTESISVSIPSITAQTDKCFTWSIRYHSTNTVIKSGPAIYRYAPIKA